MNVIFSREDKDKSMNIAPGMVERLFPSGSVIGISVTNFLNEIRPFLTQTSSTLRETLREIAGSLPSVSTV